MSTWTQARSVAALLACCAGLVYASAPARADGPVDGALTVAQAQALLSQAHGTTLAPASTATVQGQSVTPTIVADAAEALNSSGTLTSSTIGQAASDGFAVNTADGPLSFMPVGLDPNAQPGTLINGSSMLYADAWPSTDLVVRPDAYGASTWLEIRDPDAPMTYTWDVGVGPSEQFTELDDGGVAITDGSDDPLADADLTAALAADPTFGQGDNAPDDDDASDSQTSTTSTSATTSTTLTSATLTSTTSGAQPTVDTTTTSPTGTSSATATASSASTTQTPTPSAATTTVATASTTTTALTTSQTSSDATTTSTDAETDVDYDTQDDSADVVETAPPTTSTTVGAPTPNDPNPQDTQARANAAETELADAMQQTGGETTLVIEPASAIDANGAPVPTTISIDPDSGTLTITVTPTAQTAYPILVDPSMIAPSDADPAANRHVTTGLSSQIPNYSSSPGGANDYNPFDLDINNPNSPSEDDAGLDPLLTAVIKPTYARLIVPYNCVADNDTTPLTQWIGQAKDAGLKPVITIGNTPTDKNLPCYGPTPLSTSNPGTDTKSGPGAYQTDVKALITLAYGLGVRYFGAWNEPDLLLNGNPNTPGPGYVKPHIAAAYWDEASRAAKLAKCTGCTIMAGELSSYHGSDVGYLESYVNALVSNHNNLGDPLPKVWSIHDYRDLYHDYAGNDPSSAIAQFEQAFTDPSTHQPEFSKIPKPRIWITEAGVNGDYYTANTPLTHHQQSLYARTWLTLPDIPTKGGDYPRVTALFYYSYFDPPPANGQPGPPASSKTDTGLVAPAPDPDYGGYFRRPAYCGLIFDDILPQNNTTANCQGGAPKISLAANGVQPGVTSATITLDVKPNFWPTDYRVDYQEVLNPGSGKPVTISPSGNPPQSDFVTGPPASYVSKGGSISNPIDLKGDQTESVKITGLSKCNASSPITYIYEWRAAATNTQVTGYSVVGDAPTVKTTTVTPTDASGYVQAECAPEATTDAPLITNATSATVALTFTPKGSTSDTYSIEWGTDTTYGQTTPPVSVSADFKSQTDTVTLQNLQPCTTYHYQAMVTNPDSDGGTTYGGDQTFTTPCGTFALYPLATPNALPAGITEGPDGAMWFAEFGALKVGRIAADGTITEYPLPSSSFPGGIATGADGNIWVGDESHGNVDQLDLAQATPGTSDGFTAYPVPTNAPEGIAGGPESIAPGPDGALWFTTGDSINPGEIGRITTTGQITVYPLPDGAMPFDVAFGPGNTLWYLAGNIPGDPGDFVEVGSLNIAEASPGTSDGFTASYAGPSTSVVSITLGPDGNMWLSDDGNNAIDSITPDGVVTQYPIPTPNAFPEGITSGPDGALWFTENNTNAIGEITTTGQITEYPLPAGSTGPNEIAAGPNGTLWFSEQNNNAIGSFTLATP